MNTDRTQLSLIIDKETLKALKIAVAKEGKTIKDVVTDLIENYLTN